ncbi:MAG TPA: hypothetical protein VJU81_13825 [Methylomirabilota bacterium]|nr:hypothetical protein [Methylomirabilota bacterium]
MELDTVLTQGLTYLAALALPLWLLGEQVAAWLTWRRKVERPRPVEHTAPKAETAAGLRRKPA